MAQEINLEEINLVVTRDLVVNFKFTTFLMTQPYASMLTKMSINGPRHFFTHLNS